MTERLEKSAYITYLYNTLAEEIFRSGGKCELMFSDARTALRIHVDDREPLEDVLLDRLTEVIGIGYKYTFLGKKLNVSLPRREKRLMSAALIAADFEGDKTYIKRKLKGAEEYSIDGFYNFRLVTLRDKWEKIVEYVPESFSSPDLKRFCEFLVGESRRKIYLKDGQVYGENFAPLKRSRLTGSEDVETEIMLSDAGFVYCLGDVDASTEDFLRKYYAERAVFS